MTSAERILIMAELDTRQGKHRATDNGMLAWLILAFGLLAGLFVLLRSDPSVLASLGHGDTIYLVVGGLLLLFYAVSLASGQKGRLGRAIRHLSIWAGMTVALVTGYSYRDELSTVAYRVAGELLPPATP